jgi:hypothetical protein
MYGDIVQEYTLSDDIYGKRPNNTITLIIQTPLYLSHFGNLFVHKTVLIIQNNYFLLYDFNRAFTVIHNE